MIGSEAKYECPSCGNIIPVRMVLLPCPGGHKITGPTRCGCGRKGRFTLLSFKQIDYTHVPEGFEVKKKENKNES